ncbi:MAG: class I SAM-dependent methyltransferase [Pseudonocardia sp.]|nr:class I SAM-dependent methyltransferase [Pseudonocardia sp.]
MTANIVDPSNVESAKAWDGPSGASWVAHADLHDAGVARYLEPFFDTVALEPGQRVLDIGCGNGQTSIEAARRGGVVTGVDLSSAMLGLARGRAEAAGVDVEFVQADVQVAALPRAGYDRVISRNGTMFFGDPPAAFANIARTLAPGGLLVMQVWQPYDEQEWLRAFRGATAVDREVAPLPTQGPSPVSLGDPDKIRALLTGAGLAAPRIEGHAAPMYFGADGAQAEGMIMAIVGGMLDELDPGRRAVAVATLRSSIAEHLGPDGVTYASAVWIVTAGRP